MKPTLLMLQAGIGQQCCCFQNVSSDTQYADNINALRQLLSGTHHEKPAVIVAELLSIKR
jgi:hypothetical protein